MNARDIIIVGSSPVAKAFACFVATTNEEVILLEPGVWTSSETRRYEFNSKTGCQFVKIPTQGLGEFLGSAQTFSAAPLVFIFEGISARDFEKLKSRLDEKAYFIREASAQGMSAISAQFLCSWSVKEKAKQLKLEANPPVRPQGPESSRLQRIFRKLDVDFEVAPKAPANTWSTWTCQFSSPA